MLSAMSAAPTKSAFALNILVFVGDFTNREKADMELLMATAKQCYGFIRNTFEERCRTTKCFSDYTDSCVKMVSLSPILMEGVETVRQAHLEEVILDHVDETPGHKYKVCSMSPAC
ncbi:hypothetical protein TNCV_2962211 [Trichonephila clavipes]|nr:hypothetical protein TNCV_2962211 [Trichonephila clavipes]